MRSRTHRSECDFARAFDRSFGGRLVAFSSSILTPRLKDDLPVYRCFLCLGQRLGPVFRPLLVPLLDRVFRHFQTRTCSLPYLNSSDVCLPIANKTAHPVRVRLVGKRIKPEKLDFSNRRCPFRKHFHHPGNPLCQATFDESRPVPLMIHPAIPANLLSHPPCLVYLGPA